MESALVRALLAGGKSVTVWNRSRDKAEMLKLDGALMAADLDAALVANEKILIGVDNYSITRNLLE